MLKLEKTAGNIPTDVIIAAGIITDAIIADRNIIDGIISNMNISNMIITGMIIADKIISDGIIADLIITDKIISDEMIKDRSFSDIRLWLGLSHLKETAASSERILQNTALQTGRKWLHLGEFSLFISWGADRSSSF